MNNEDMLEMLESMKTMVSMFAGIKQSAIEAGFTEDTAEQIVLEFVRKATA